MRVWQQLCLQHMYTSNFADGCVRLRLPNWRPQRLVALVSTFEPIQPILILKEACSRILRQTYNASLQLERSQTLGSPMNRSSNTNLNLTYFTLNNTINPLADDFYPGHTK